MSLISLSRRLAFLAAIALGACPPVQDDETSTSTAALQCAQNTAGLDVVTVKEGAGRLRCASPP